MRYEEDRAKGSFDRVNDLFAQFGLIDAPETMESETRTEIL